MILWIDIVGTQCNDPHAQDGQRLYRGGARRPQCKYYGLVKNYDSAALTLM